MDRIHENLWNLKVNNRVPDCFTLLYQSINQSTEWWSLDVPQSIEQDCRPVIVFVQVDGPSGCSIRVLQQAQRNWCLTGMNAEGRVERFAELAAESVEVTEVSISGHPVEGQRTRGPVEEDCYSARIKGERSRYDCRLVHVASWELVAAEQTPGPLVVSNPAVVILPLPSDSLVRDSNVDPSFPVHFPVAASCQPFPTQHLLPVVESLWTVRVRQPLRWYHHLVVVPRQREMTVCGVWVQCELARNCLRKRSKILS